MRFRQFAPLGLGCVLALAGCHKTDVDADDLVTNPFDPAFTGANPLFTIDSVTTVLYQGAIHDQKLYVEVHPDRFPTASGYELWLIETLPGADTVVYTSILEPDDDLVLRNFNVDLGTLYCYRVELHVGSDGVKREEICALAEM